jgi:uncharacterized FlaG/YvyC family protein
MTDALEIKFDEKRLDEIRRMLRDIPNAMPKVISRGINRTTTSTRAEIARQISAEVKITQSAVKKGIKVTKATQTRWQADLDLFAKRIPLIKFGAKQLKKGVSYRISKSGGRKKITDPARPFIQTLPSGHKGVFRRKTPGTKRLPIVQLKGPSIGGVFEGAAGIAAEVQESSSLKLTKNIDRQIAFILSRRRA